MQRELDAITEMQLLEDVIEMGFHRTFADRQALGDFRISQTFRDMARNFRFAVGQAMVGRSAELGGELGLERGWHPYLSIGYRADRIHQGIEGKTLMNNAAGAVPDDGKRVLDSFAGRN